MPDSQGNGAGRAGDRTDELAAAVAEALDQGEALNILGSGSKTFFGREPSGRNLQVGAHSGVVSYEPTELVITARAGTRVADVDALLADNSQMLAFEPPRFGANATVGGTVACNMSGPRRPYAGAARDFVLGTRVLNGRAEVLRFGGEVMKNVAGYDVSRLMAGALGTLGLLLEVSLKVLPKPETEATRCFRLEAGAAIDSMNAMGGRPLPVSGMAWVEGLMYVRLSGSEAGVSSAVAEIGGDQPASPVSDRFWDDLREHRLPFFQPAGVLWRISLPPAAGPVPIDGDWLIDWGGGQRWLWTDAGAESVRQAAVAAGGHATQFRGGDRAGDIFQPLTDSMFALHRRVKMAMDPGGVFNPGRMYAGI